MSSGPLGPDLAALSTRELGAKARFVIVLCLSLHGHDLNPILPLKQRVARAVATPAHLTGPTAPTNPLVMAAQAAVPVAEDSPWGSGGPFTLIYSAATARPADSPADRSPAAALLRLCPMSRYVIRLLLSLLSLILIVFYI